MTQKQLNIFMAIATVLQAIILSLSEFKIDPNTHKVIMAILMISLIVFNGLANFKSETMLTLNIIALIGFIAGGIVDYVDLIPNLSEVAKSNILAGLTLIVTLTNIFKKAMTSFLPIEKTE